MAAKKPEVARSRSLKLPPELRLAPLKAQPPQRWYPPKPIRVMLTQRHTINGTPYGPGQVTVPPDIGHTLQEQEQRAASTEAAFHDRRAFVVDRYLRKIPVAPERFDAVLFSDTNTVNL